MRKVIEWAVRNPTVINLMMVGIALISLFSIDQLPKEAFPETALDIIRVDIEYRGAGPKEIETGILLKVEESVESIAGIDKVSSEAKENFGFVSLELSRGTNSDRVLRDIKDAVEKIPTFPKDAEKPSIYMVMRRTPVIQFVLSGKASRAQIQTLADKLKEDLLTLSLVKQVDIQGAKKREISIEINEESLRRFKLKISDVTTALQAANFDMSGGTLKTKSEDLRIRIYGKKYLAKEINEVIIRNVQGGNAIRLRDVGKAREAFEDVPIKLTYNGKPSVILSVQSKQSDNILKIAAQVKGHYKNLQSQLPVGVTMAIYKDTTINLKSRISLLVKNGAQGLVLVLFVLAFFMNIRLAFWVAAGLFLSLMGAFISAWFVGLSINMISLFGLILVIGILVDDAIVVAENVYSHLERGKSPIEAAIDGTREVAPAVLIAVITTCLTFMPLFFLGGFIGKFIYMIPAMVIAALLWSLFESLLILPPHLAHSLKPRNSVEYTQSKMRGMIDGGFDWFKTRIYARTLSISLSYRWAVLAGSVALFFLTIGLIGGGLVKFVFFPKIERDSIVVRFTMKPGTPLNQTEKVVKLAEKTARLVGGKLKKKYGKPAIVHTLSWLGTQTDRNAESGEEVAEVQVELTPGEERNFSSFEAIKLWRQIMGRPAGVIAIQFSQLQNSPVGRAMEFRLESNNYKQLKQATEYLKKKLGAFPGVFNPNDDLTVGKRELRLERTPMAVSLGISMQTIANQVRYRLYGQDVMRLQRGTDDVRMVVRYPNQSQGSMKQLKNIWVTTAQGKRLPLPQLVTWRTSRELKVIRRENRRRQSTVFAQLDESQGNRRDIIQELSRTEVPNLKKLTPAVRVVVAGQGREQAKVVSGMKIALPLSMFGVFFVISLIFPAYGKILIVMSMIPFGLIGAVLGHWLLSTPLTILSFFGIVGVAGVVVNDSIVLMDAINRQSETGIPVREAVWLAGQSRLRAILSTTLTTGAGLTPLLMEKSMQAQYLIPMALSLAAGVTFATFLTLVLVPSLYLIRLDMKRFWHWLRNGEWLDLDTMEIRDNQRHTVDEPLPTPSSEHIATSPALTHAEIQT